MKLLIVIFSKDYISCWIYVSVFYFTVKSSTQPKWWFCSTPSMDIYQYLDIFFVTAAGWRGKGDNLVYRTASYNKNYLVQALRSRKYFMGLEIELIGWDHLLFLQGTGLRLPGHLWQLNHLLTPIRGGQVPSSGHCTHGALTDINTDKILNTHKNKEALRRWRTI